MEFDVITANYNNGNYLESFFNSFLNSSKKPKKIIFVDDCSTDNSLEIVYKFIDKNELNIKLILNSKNIGFANSLNIGIKYLESDFFMRIDPDDYVFSDRFAKQLSYLEDNPDIDIVGTNVTYVLNGCLKSNSDVVVDENQISNLIKKGILPVIHGSICGKSLIFKDFNYKQTNVPAEDYDLFAYIVSKKFRIVNISDSLTYVRIHANSVSNDLKFSTVVKRFSIAYDYFGFKKSKFGIFFEYIHQYMYRKYLFDDSLKKYIFLVISAASMPLKTINKIKNKLL